MTETLSKERIWSLRLAFLLFQLRIQIGKRCLEHLPMPWIGDSFKLLTHTLARKQKPFMAVFGSSLFGTQRSPASLGGRSFFLLLLY